MSKYIIRNCNVLYFNPDKTAICNDLNLECPCECKERADCVMKQIVEKCKKTCRMRCTNDCLGTKKHCGYGQILKLLDIQECE